MSDRDTECCILVITMDHPNPFIDVYEGVKGTVSPDSWRRRSKNAGSVLIGNFLGGSDKIFLARKK